MRSQTAKLGLFYAVQDCYSHLLLLRDGARRTFLKMSKFIQRLIPLSLIVFSIFSCTKEQETIKATKVTIRASFGDSSSPTKTSIDATGKMYWLPGDDFYVYSVDDIIGGDTPNSFVTDIESPALSALFVGELDVDDNAPYVALYPGNNGVFELNSYWGVEYDGSMNGQMTGNLVSEQHEQFDDDWNFDFDNNILLAAYTEDSLDELFFQNVCSGLKFTVSENNITAVIFRGNNGEDIAGGFSLDFFPDDSGVVVPVAAPIDGSSSKEVTLNGYTGFFTGHWLYLVFLPQTFEKGITITFVYGDGQEKTLTMSGPLTFTRSVWKKAENLNDRAEVTKLAYEAVDLGLSVKWATCNVGASAPEEYGYYLAWGETEPKSSYSYSNYKYCKSNKYLTKYCTYSGQGDVDNRTILDSRDDAASAVMGRSWRMPTTEEWTELKNNCTFKKQNGGLLVTSKKEGYTDRSIFLPSTGYKKGSGSSGVGSSAIYWSSELYYATSSYSPQKASAIAWSSSSSSPFFVDQNNERWNGAAVRAVLP